MSVGTQRTLARVSSASATQTLACAAATISGRASESRRAVARLIGKRRSVGSSGAALSFSEAPRPSASNSTAGSGRPPGRSGSAPTGGPAAGPRPPGWRPAPAGRRRPAPARSPSDHRRRARRAARDGRRRAVASSRPSARAAASWPSGSARPRVCGRGRAVGHRGRRGRRLRQRSRRRVAGTARDFARRGESPSSPARPGLARPCAVRRRRSPPARPRLDAAARSPASTSASPAACAATGDGLEPGEQQGHRRGSMARRIVPSYHSPLHQGPDGAITARSCRLFRFSGFIG